MWGGHFRFCPTRKENVSRSCLVLLARSKHLSKLNSTSLREQRIINNNKTHSTIVKYNKNSDND